MMSETLEWLPSKTIDRGWQSDRSLAKQFGLETNQPRVAVLVPCRNEAAAIGKVGSDFQRALPDAIVYVYDNNSTDHTMLEARAAGGGVRGGKPAGKRQVGRGVFA